MAKEFFERHKQPWKADEAGQLRMLAGKGKGLREIAKAIGEAARKELSELLGQKVHLFLHVKVDENWEDNREIYEEMGLDWVR